MTLPAKLAEWFLRRGVDEDTLQLRGVRFNPAAAIPAFHTKPRPCMEIPIYSHGREINCYRRSPTGLSFNVVKHDFGAQVFYNLDELDGDDQVIITTSPLDALILLAAGLGNVIAMPNIIVPQNAPEGTLAALWMAPLANAGDRLAKVRKFILAMNNDPLGDVVADELSRRFGAEVCWRVHWPAGTVEKTAQHGGHMALADGVENAAGLPVRGLLQIERGTLKRYREQESERLFSTGWDNIDSLFRIPLGRLMVVTGIPSHGKSEWVDAMAINTAVNYGWSWAVCTQEHPMDEHAGKLAEKYLNRPLYDYEGAEQASDSDLGIAEAWINRHFSFIREEGDEALTLDYVLERARIAVMRYGIRGLVIDPYNEIEHEFSRNMSQEQYQSRFLARCRKFAARHDILFVIIAHPTKLDTGRGGAVPVPGLYDISGSAHWKNKCDLGVTVFKPADLPNCADIYLEKRKFKRWGKPGNTRLHWDPVTGRYTETLAAQSESLL